MQISVGLEAHKALSQWSVKFGINGQHIVYQIPPPDGATNNVFSSTPDLIAWRFLRPTGN